MQPAEGVLEEKCLLCSESSVLFQGIFLRVRIHLHSLISLAAKLKILNSLCCAQTLCYQPSTFPLSRAKQPTQRRAPSRRMLTQWFLQILHYLAGQAFHLLISIRTKEFLALVRYGVHMAAMQQGLRSNCRHIPPSGRCSHTLLTKTSLLHQASTAQGSVCRWLALSSDAPALPVTSQLSLPRSPIATHVL